MTIAEYVEAVNRRYKSGYSREHSYRGDLQALLESLLPEILVTNEPKRSDVGAPDYILTKGNIPVGYIEAKDIDDSDLSGKKKNKEQFNRYKDGLPSIIFTDYLDFHLYRDGGFITSIRIAKVQDGQIKGKPESYGQFSDLIKDFGTPTGQTIRSANKLSKMMAGKARLLSNVIENALNVDQEEVEKGNIQANNTLREQLSAFQNILIHDIDAKEFADIYAQTIAYGMFAARLHDPTLESFDRREAADLIPKTNPFLRRLFGYIAGPDIDERIVWIVDGLADIFRATDVEGLIKNFGKSTQQQDPIIHFYETFLAEYDPSLRKSRGVWYTPEPVVKFIVRAVDDILKDEFGLKEGLADTSKTKIKVNTDVPDKRSSTGYKQEEREVHKVQILDPATGTGTFLAEVVKKIHSRFEGQQGIWKQYVEEHLIPRLNGFEILMASYAMAHLKLDLLIQETGVEPSGNQRFRVYLTNSLEEHHPDTGTLFASWLSQEANDANHLKRDTPVMVVVGNPPYSVSSSNKGVWIEELMKDYKKDLNEKNIQPLSDDYIKFIRYGQYYINKNSEGVLAYISNNGYIDGLVHKQMRKSLLDTFDEIIILNLHGNSNKKETAPDGGLDQNIFDIRQGVAIGIFIKKSAGKGSSSIKTFDLFGSRETKYNWLQRKKIYQVDWKKIEVVPDNYLFHDLNLKLKRVYDKGFKLSKLMRINTGGIKTHRDQLVIDFSRNALVEKISNFFDESISNKYIKEEYGVKENKKWQLQEKRNGDFDSQNIIKMTYRPFDNRFLYNSKSLVDRDREKVMKHMLNDDNIALICARSNKTNQINHFFITKCLSEMKTGERSNGSYHFPLFLTQKDTSQQTIDGRKERKPNLDKNIIQKIAKNLGLTFTIEKEDLSNSFASIDLLDYIYAVFNSPSYRMNYKEFLKAGFPKVPYPENPKQFWRFVELGGELRQIHLLEHPTVEDFITTYPESGTNIISNRLTKNDPGFVPDEDDKTVGKVWINDEQYFGNVPKKAWEFYIGGYQPAEKWLKDRRDRKLSIEEIQHYQKIIVALIETDRLMQEIDKVNYE